MRTIEEAAGISERSDPDSGGDPETLRRSLYAFVKHAWPVLEPGTPYIDNWHIEVICEYLEAVTRGEITRLIVNIPPRYMKSKLISIFWPVWEWIERPQERWVFATHDASLGTDHSVERRRLIESHWFESRWGDRVRLLRGENRLTEYTNTARGRMLSASMAGGRVHGKGGNRLVIDDPHNPKKALSEKAREDTLQDFRQALYPRLNSKRHGAIVVVMQRLHEDDLSGHLLRSNKAGKFVHVRIPAIADQAEDELVRTPPSPKHPRGRAWRRDPGEPLWPERESAEELASFDDYVFAGQYQQRPAPLGGGMFKRAWFQIVEALPVGITHRVRAWDKAATTGPQSANTAGVKMVRDTQGVFYITDIIVDKLGPVDREELIRQTAGMDGWDVEVAFEREGGSSGITDADATVRGLPGYVVTPWNVSGQGDKVWRARPLATQAKAGNLRLLNGPWVEEFLREAANFPYGRKDRIDAAAIALAILAPKPKAGRAATGGRRKEVTGYEVH